MAADQESGMPEAMAIHVAEALWLARHMPADALEPAVSDAPAAISFPSGSHPSPQDRNFPGGHQPPRPPSGPAEWQWPLSSVASSLVVGEEPQLSTASPPPSLPRTSRSRDFTRALKPLRVTVPSPLFTALDEERTAEDAAAFQGLWLPRVHPLPERAFDVVLMVDNHYTMDPWRQTLDEFRDSLGYLGAFRDVRQVSLDVAAARDAPADLLHLVQRTNSRQLVLLLTDGLADVWREGQLNGPLHRLARSHLLTIVHMMEASSWRTSHLQGRRTDIRSNGAVPHSNTEWRVVSDRRNGHPSPAGITVPVLALEERFLRRWAAFVTGQHPAVSLPTLTLTAPTTDDARRISPPAAPAGPAHEPALLEDPAALEDRLLAQLSPAQFFVACAIAGVPLTDVNMHVALREVAPQHESLLPSTLHALLANNAIQPLAVPQQPRTRGFPTATMDFNPGVRAQLLAHTSTSDTVRAVRAAHRHPHPDDVWAHFDVAALDNPKATHPALTAETLRRAEVSAALFTAISGRYRPLGKRLTQATRTFRDGGTQQLSSQHLSAPVPAQRNRSLVRAGRTRWENVPPRNRYFTGRTQQLERLHELLAPSGFAEVAVLGMAGVGKTQLALEYIYRYGDIYDLICWIPAEHANVPGLRDSYWRLAAKLRLDDVALSDDDPVTAVLEALRNGAAADRWLLVVDDARQVDIRPLLPVGGLGHVIVTSRNTRWDLEQDALRVEVFERTESTALLVARNPRLSEDEAEGLAKHLGDLPQAVEAASRMLAETGMPVDNYQRPTTASLLAAAAHTPPPGSAATSAWTVTLDQLQEHDPSAYALLQVCAWLADEPVSQTLLPGLSELQRQPGLPQLDYLHGDLELFLAIRELNRAALVQVNERDGTLTIHRLLRQMVMERMSDDERQASRRTVHLLLAARSPETGAHDREYLRLAPHVISSGMVESDETVVRRAVVAMVRCLARHDEQATARFLAETALTAWQGDNRSSHWALRRDLRRGLRRLP